MASALARGIGEPIVVHDRFAERAEALAAATGGTVASSNAEVAAQADAIVLAHKPAQLAEVAAEIGAAAKTVVSILGGVQTSAVEAAYPGAAVYRFLPNIPVEVRQGVLCFARGTVEGPEAEIRELFGRLGTVVELPEPLIEPAMALASCGPAWIALVAEALIDAGVLHGLSADDATELVVETLAGTAAVLRETGGDTRDLRRRVTSPGGVTAVGLSVLEHAQVRAAFEDAVGAVVRKVAG
jgi:pyrroline-5-carboxylate reductase